MNSTPTRNPLEKMPYKDLINSSPLSDVDGYFKLEGSIPDDTSDTFLEAGLFARQLSESPFIDLETLVRQIHENPLDLNRTAAGFMEKAGVFPIKINRAYRPDSENLDILTNPFAILAMPIYSMGNPTISEKPHFIDPSLIEIQLTDRVLPALENLFHYKNTLTAQDISLILLSPADYKQLVAYSNNPEERGKFISEINENTSSDNYLRALFVRAIKQNASDIHFEPLTENSFRIRYRIDGKLHVEPITLTKTKYHSVISAMKIAGNLNISERRRPQDGGVVYLAGTPPVGTDTTDITKTNDKNEPNEEIALTPRHTNIPLLIGRGFRISTIPLDLGEEKGVVRILPESKTVHIDNLGLEEYHKRDLKENMVLPSGIILFTGPTGSGKTTTIGACLGYINTNERNILTIEQPPEIIQEGLNQSGVIPAIDWTFATAMKNFLRQDPDVIYVGEMRDRETAKMAVAAAKTGHLVVSTLHANDAVESVRRLVDLDVTVAEMYSTLACIVAQRLVGKFISYEENLFVPYDPAKQLNDIFREEIFKKNELSLYMPNPDVLKDAKLGNGYKGRTSIMEIWTLDNDSKELLYRNTGSKNELVESALHAGMIPMVVHGMNLVKRGVTSIAEITRVVPTSDFRLYKNLIVPILRGEVNP